jgi:hypothetical protein
LLGNSGQQQQQPPPSKYTYQNNLKAILFIC